ncbi:MAG TPA: DMT family transporter [Burkholderiales bacterium]|nr:DMT family transporter [Burkholderiales bacterium]
MGDNPPVTPADYARLGLLAALWGGAFVFLRVAAPVLGPVWTAEFRVLLGGLALLAWFRLTGFDAGLRRHARFYLLIGSVNIAVPFALYSYAAMHAPASLLSIVNATAPIFGLAWSALFRDERVTLRKATGLILGVAGVALIVRPPDGAPTPQLGWALAAALSACCAYGVTGVLMKRFASGASPRGMAVGNQLAAALVLLPLLPVLPPLATPTPLVIANLLALALLASGVAFLLYFRLIVDIGATRALTVTYLIPLFGVLWGWIFLDETLPAAALAGGALILAGTVLVTRS